MDLNNSNNGTTTPQDLPSFAELKLKPNGDFKYFPGNSIVCWITEQEHSIWFQALCTAQQIVRQSKVGHFFSFLPPSVFHVTIFDLVTDLGREKIKDQWPFGIPFDAPMEDIEAEMINRTRPLFAQSQQTRFVFKFKHVLIGLQTRVFSIILEPIDIHMSETLSKWRRAASDYTKIPFSEKTFHITLAYQRAAMSEFFNEEIQRVTAILTKGFTSLTGSKAELRLNPPVISFFRDMADMRTVPLFSSNLRLLESTQPPSFSSALSRELSNMKLSVSNCVILVLGKGLKKNGKPHSILKVRLRKAVSLYYEKKFLQKYKVYLLFAGGHTAQTLHSEAEAMKQWILAGFDIDPNVILLEERSQNTLENAYFSKSLLYQHGISSGELIVITSDYHMQRTMVIFNHVFGKTGFLLNYISTPTDKYDKENALESLIKREQEIMARTPELLDLHDKHLADRPVLELSLLEEVRRGNLRGVERWLSVPGRHPDSEVDEKGRGALHLAAQFSRQDQAHLQIARILIQAGADVNRSDKQGVRSLHLAAMRGHTALVQLLGDAGAEKSTKASSEFWTGCLSPLEIASLAVTKQITTEVEHALLTLDLWYPQSQTKTVFLIRHAESLANRSFSLKKPLFAIDPRLSEQGEKQLQQLRSALYPRIERLQIELIITSPMSRTLQTCLGLFEQLAVQKNIRILVDERISEHLSDICDIGRPKSHLMKEFTSSALDWSQLKEFWWYIPPNVVTHHNFITVTKEPIEYLRQRLQSFWQFLESRNEKNIVVISHGGALKALTNTDFTLRNLEVFPLFVPFKKK
jgi:broad specificity phosphatase PhoE/uncharacterized SAM-binding protein YcdF (DUF218 family)